MSAFKLAMSFLHGKEEGKLDVAGLASTTLYYNKDKTGKCFMKINGHIEHIINFG